MLTLLNAIFSYIILWYFLFKNKKKKAINRVDKIIETHKYDTIPTASTNYSFWNDHTVKSTPRSQQRNLLQKKKCTAYHGYATSELIIEDYDCQSILKDVVEDCLCPSFWNRNSQWGNCQHSTDQWCYFISRWGSLVHTFTFTGLAPLKGLMYSESEYL